MTRLAGGGAQRRAPAVGGLLLWLGAMLAFLPARALEWEAHEGFRIARLAVPATGKTGFTTMPGAQTGIHFTNVLPQARSLTNHILLNGSGLAFGDVDGDGWCDLFLSALGGRSALYRNLGDWKFADITESAGAACPDLDATGAVFADVDGDGDMDLLVNGVGAGTRCFLNDGRGRFHNATAAAGLASNAGTTSVALADLDGDGDLDLYQANYRTWTMRDFFNLRVRVKDVAGRKVVTMVNGRPVTEPDLVGRFTVDERGQLVEHGEANALYLNDGRGRFASVSFTNGVFLDEHGQALSSAPYDWSLTAIFRDLNGDGAPDLYVCNDLGSPDRVWMNQGQGRFQAQRPLSLRKECWFSMGADVADVNRDGWDDLFVSDMLAREHQKRHTQNTDHKSLFLPIGQFDDRPSYARSMLYLNLGDGDFSEIAYLSGVAASDWSWSPAFLDVDLDGYEDLLITTGFERDVQDIDLADFLERERRAKRLPDDVAIRRRRLFPRLEQANLAFHNRADLTFEEVGRRWGFDFQGVSQAIAFADLDHDGDLDAVINNMNAAVSVLRNDSVAPRLAVRLRGLSPNTRGIGARIQVSPAGAGAQASALPVQTQEMMCGGRYLAGDDALRTFAAGSLTNEFEIEVIWRSGRRSVARAQANQLCEIDERQAESRPPASANRPTPLFEDVSAALGHRHHEEPFDDFERQPLLPRRLSQLGPGVSWFDFDGDGHEDLFVGSGKGGALGALRNDGRGAFQRLTNGPFRLAAPRDQTTLLGWRASSNAPGLLIGSANFEDGRTNGAAVQRLDFTADRLVEAIPATSSSPGPLALADMDGDGDLDLFVGGRTVPGRYPESAVSRLFHHEAGQWKLDEANTRVLAPSGLVSGAVLSDLTGDGLPELILACEWGPLRIFVNQRGKLAGRDWPLSWAAENAKPPTSNSKLQVATLNPQPSTLNQLTGWWNGVTTGDLDGDGRLDLIASNWGRNSKYQDHRAQPLRLYFGDFDGDGQVKLVEAYYDPPLGKIVPWATLDRLGDSLLLVRPKFMSFHEYGLASLGDILGDALRTAQVAQANWLESAVFLNRGDHFLVQPLPLEAQLSPAFAVIVADADGDGHEDVFLSQNFFATDSRTGRYDGGRGLWLRGDGRGGLVAMTARETGIRVYGEGRGAAVCDFDGDGRVDLAVAQNGSETKLFKNLGARAGLRVRLGGPPGNPAGIGAALRLGAAGERGPLREIHAGAGYWSQASAVQVLARPAGPARLWVRWPGGAVQEAEVPAGAREIALDRTGRVRQLR